MVSKTRAKRIADRIREELSVMLIHEIADPRVAGIFITDVEVDRELAFAQIFFSSLEGSERAEENLDGLSSAKGFIKHELADRIELRTFPDLRFYFDPTFERAERIEELFREIHQSDESTQDSSTNKDHGTFEDGNDAY
jgi:ribosome-binding factor A